MEVTTSPEGTSRTVSVPRSSYDSEKNGSGLFGELLSTSGVPSGHKSPSSGPDVPGNRRLGHSVPRVFPGPLPVGVRFRRPRRHGRRGGASDKGTGMAGEEGCRARAQVWPERRGAGKGHGYSRHRGATGPQTLTGPPTVGSRYPSNGPEGWMTHRLSKEG